MATCFRALRTALVIVLAMAICSSGRGVYAAPAAMYPAECPSATSALPVAITLAVTLQRPNDPAPDPSWAVPVHFSLHPPGRADIICWEWDLNLDNSGQWAGNLTLFTGLYDARVKNLHTLRNVKPNVNIAGPMTINMGTLLEGDASNNNWINAQDFSMLVATWLKNTGDPGFDARADFDENGSINVRDFALLLMNYWKRGDIAVP